MTLHIDLRPYEAVRVGRAVIAAGPARIAFSINGSEPVLRERDMINEIDVNCPMSRLRFLLQELYLESRSREDAHDEILDGARAVFFVDHSHQGALHKIVSHFEEGDLFRALKTAIRLHEYMQPQASRRR